MKRWISNGILGTLGLVGCVLWTGCGGGGGSVQGASDVRVVRAAESPGTIRLSWTPSPEQGVLGYTIRRRLAGSETFAPVTNRLIREVSFTDQLPDPNDTRTMVYQVIAVAASGGVGDPAEVTAIVGPPTPPDGF